MSRPIKKNLPETGRLLAPAGSMECLEAALRAGADGVYFGGRGLNARQKAENFGPEELCRAADLCRLWGAESFLTLNTVLKDGELSEAFDLLEQAAFAGVTGVIVQDLSLAERIKTHFPGLELHASTQMAVTSTAGLRLLEQLGFDQAVLARECSAEEIARMKQETNIHLEVFCHGALCMGLSGQCYMSALIGGRSGNRGLCAQPCRLDFSLPGFEKCLSLKDLCLIARLKEMQKMGIRTLKIEGRMKRPEYVMAAVSAYRAALDGSTPDTKALEAVFSRSGFTEGCFAGPVSRSMFGFRRKEDVQAADSGMLKAIRRQNEKEAAAVLLEGRFQAQNGKASFWVTDGKNEATAEEPVPKSVQPKTEEEVKKAISRALCSTGDTPFVLEPLSISAEKEAFLPDSLLRSLRRRALEELAKKRQAFSPPPKADKEAFLRPTILPRERGPQQAAAVCRSARQFSALRGKIKEVYLPLEAAERLQLTEEERKTTGILLPPVFFQVREEAYLQKVKEAGFCRVLAQSPGVAFAAIGAGMHVVLGPTLNIRSRETEAAWRRLGAEETIRSFESSLPELKSCDQNSGAILYGRLPLMVLRACPRKAKEGCAGCKKYYEIQDRTGRVFPVFCGGEAAVLHNADPLWLSDQTQRFSAPGRAFFWFTGESEKEIGAVLKAYERGETPKGSFTRGLYQRREEKHLAQQLRQERSDKKRGRAPENPKNKRGRKSHEGADQNAETGRQMPPKSHRGQRRL